MDWQSFADNVWDSVAVDRDRSRRDAWHAGLTQSTFRTFVRVAWFASMMAEEGRHRGGRLVLGPAVRPSLPFAEPVPYNERAVTKLTPLVETGHRQLVVRCEDGQLRIIGLRDAFFRYRRWLTRRPRGPAAATHLLTRLIAPGHIRLGAPVQRDLCRGVVHPLTPLDQTRAFADWFGDAGRHLEQRTSATGPQPAAFAVQRIWTRVLREVVDGETGGTFLVVPDDGNDWRDLLHIQPSHECNSLILQDTLREMQEIQAALPAYGEVTGEHSAQLINMAHFHERDLELAAEMVAALARVDGAVLVTRSLRILAFGVKIAAPHCTDVRQRAVDTEERQRPWTGLALTGARHGSAANFVAADAGCAAIVISRDGEVTTFVREDQHVVAEHVSLNEDWLDADG